MPPIKKDNTKIIVNAANVVNGVNIHQMPNKVEIIPTINDIHQCFTALLKLENK